MSIQFCRQLIFPIIFFSNETDCRPFNRRTKNSASVSAWNCNFSKNCNCRYCLETVKFCRFKKDIKQIIMFLQIMLLKEIIGKSLEIKMIIRFVNDFKPNDLILWKLCQTFCKPKSGLGTKPLRDKKLFKIISSCSIYF